MKINRVLGFLLLALSFSSPVTAQTLDELMAQWKQHKYQQILPGLAVYWNTQPDGKSWLVGYMIGSSECQIEGYQNYGVAMLEEVLQHLKMPDEARHDVEDYLNSCRQRTASEAATGSFALTPVLSQSVPAQVVGMTKGGFIPQDRSSMATSKIAVTPISTPDLQKRLHSFSESGKALAEASQRMGGSWTGAIVGPFALVSPISGTDFARDTGECLLKYEKPLEKEFGMKPPAKVVTVYFTPYGEGLGDFARKLHGFQLPLGSVAYSVYQDLSIVGIGGPEACGSLGHELVHLMIRGNFGNSPAWLEEGLASEVAVVMPKPETFEFARSWRDQMLRDHWKLRPTVAQLLEMNWTNYMAASEAELQKVAAIHAMAAVFVRYLADTKQLLPVYFGVRDHRFNKDLTQRRTDAEILEKQLGKNIEAVDADFAQWFKELQDANPAASPHPTKN
jgi:hypothetical protein